MVKSLNNEVLEKIDDIVSYVKESDTYKRYLEVEEKMKNNLDIMDKINKIKSIQKEIVKLEIDKKDISSLEKEVDEIISNLNTYPIYQEYSYLLEDLNNTFQEIKFIIENYLNNKIN